MSEQTVIYEYLVRFNPDGTVRGSHVGYLRRIIDDETGELLSERESGALPVGTGQHAVQLQSALGELAAALATAEEVERTARIDAESARAAAIAQRDAAISERDARQAERDALQAALDAERGRSAFHVRKSVVLRRMTASERRAWRQAVKRAESANNPTQGDLYAEDAMMIFEHVGPALDTSDSDAQAFGLALVFAGVLATAERVAEILQPEH